jgi:hypothetical protein
MCAGSFHQIDLTMAKPIENGTPNRTPDGDIRSPPPYTHTHTHTPAHEATTPQEEEEEEEKNKHIFFFFFFFCLVRLHFDIELIR